MTYRYHPELQELVDDPAGFPPAEKFVGTLEEMRAFADPLYAEMRDLPLAEGVVARDVEIETADGYPMRARWYRKEGSDARSAVMYVHGGGMILMGIDEMDADTLGLVSDYSVDGKLIGHIVRGVVNIQLAAEKTKANPGKALLLQHMVLSHHGIPEYGSPLAPKFPEAEVLNTIDTLDARLYEMDEALSRAIPGGFSEKVWGLDNRQLYRIPEDEVE